MTKWLLVAEIWHKICRDVENADAMGFTTSPGRFLLMFHPEEIQYLYPNWYHFVGKDSQIANMPFIIWYDQPLGSYMAKCDWDCDCFLWVHWPRSAWTHTNGGQLPGQLYWSRDREDAWRHVRGKIFAYNYRCTTYNPENGKNAYKIRKMRTSRQPWVYISV